MTRKEQIIDLFKSGKTKPEIWEMLGCTNWTVINVIRNAKLEPPKYKLNNRVLNQEQINRIKVLIQFNNGSDSDYTNSEIADDLKVSIQNVNDAIALINYEKRRDRKDN